MVLIDVLKKAWTIFYGLDSFFEKTWTIVHGFDRFLEKKTWTKFMVLIDLKKSMDYSSWF